MNELEELALLIHERNGIARRITDIIGRPAQIGHVGEFIASRVFDIKLEESAIAKGIDGVFRSGALAGKTVNVKFYAKFESILAVCEDGGPDYYLVLTGPRTKAMTSRGEARLWHIDFVFLFNEPILLQHLQDRGVVIGVATSVISEQWKKAEIFPTQTNPELQLSEDQQDMLKLFGSTESDV
ncbi:MAG: hypothetical protein J3T61_07815 [Candidatus Brocadiales bacterium]|nr:hypothetical protein [Candidatus Bathyanammoxibius sp.]